MRDENHLLTDRHILDVINGGDQDGGFRLLVKAYKERIYWQVRRMVNDHEDANDLTQDVFIKVFKNLSKYQGKSALYTWIYRIASNETLTFLKRKKTTAPIMLMMESPDEAKAPDGEKIQQLLAAGIAKLPVRQKQVFNLRYFDEMKYENISQILNLSKGAIKASYHHAAKKIEAYVIQNMDK